MKNEQEILQYYTEELEKYTNSKICHFIGPNHPLVSIDDWKLCCDNGIDLASSHAIYCESGKKTHNAVRESYNLNVIGVHPTYDNENEQRAHWGDTIGLKTPRKGFYKVISISDDGKILNCYYNYKRGNAFLEEIVEINREPFYNKSSIGPKHELIQVNDVIEVIDTRLSECVYEGQSYKAYRIVWGFC